jgi:hypothetical protein
VQKCWIILCFLLSNGVVSAQVNQQPADSTQAARTDSSAIKEVSLEDIHIDAVVEKPAVTLIPKRIPPELGDAPEMSRSFDRELKQRPQFLDEPGHEMENGQRLQTSKKNLAKEKK